MYINGSSLNLQAIGFNIYGKKSTESGWVCFEASFLIQSPNYLVGL